MRRVPPLLAAAGLLCMATGGFADGLRVLGSNPRYFERNSKPLVLFGSGLWTIISDTSVDIAEHNEWYASRGANSSRASLFAFCVQEGRDDLLAPWLRTGPGEARDDKPKFDLSKWDERFFARMHEYFSDCQQRGIIVLLQMFDEPFVERAPNRWGLNPFNAENNINGIPGLPGGEGSGEEAFYNPDNAQLMAIQDALIRRLLNETAQRHDNIIYEIGNEINMDSVTSRAAQWQQHWVGFFRAYEEAHPGLKLILTNDTREGLMAEAKDAWGALNHHGMDHIRPTRLGVGELADAVSRTVRKRFDEYRRPILNSRPCSDPDRTNYSDIISEDGGRALYLSYLFSGGHVIGFRTTVESWKGGERAENIIHTTRVFADSIPFAEMTPRPELAKGDHALCLCKDGGPVAVYLPLGGTARVRLSGFAEGQSVGVRMYDPRTREFAGAGRGQAPVVELRAPTSGEGNDWAFVIEAR